MQPLPSRCLFTYIHCPAFHYDPLTSLPCGKLNSPSGWAYRGALHESLSIPPGLCLPKWMGTQAITVVRTEYVVMSFRVRLLAVTGCLFSLR